MRSVHWLNSTQSGLCDRFLDIGFLAALARVTAGKLYMEWQPYGWRPELDPPHRAIDVLVENVLHYVKLPPEVVLHRGIPEPQDLKLSDYLGASMPLNDFHRLYVAPVSSLTVAQFDEIVKTVFTEFTFNDDVSCYANALPKKFIAFHIRRTDKIRPAPPDGYIIKSSDLEQLDRATFQAIDAELPNYSEFLLCGDDDAATTKFVHYLRARGKRVIDPPLFVEKWRSTYYDLASMSHSEKVVVAHRYSSFSRVAALIGRKPFCSIFEYPGVGYV